MTTQLYLRIYADNRKGLNITRSILALFWQIPYETIYRSRYAHNIITLYSDFVIVEKAK